MGWQTLETAPRDGTEILVFRPAQTWRRKAKKGFHEIDLPMLRIVAHWHIDDRDPATSNMLARRKRMMEQDGGYWATGASPIKGTVTRWMPLPEPPADGGADG